MLVCNHDGCDEVPEDRPGANKGWVVVDRDRDGNADVVLCPAHAEDVDGG